LAGADPDPQLQILSEVFMIESYKKYNREQRENDEGCCTLF
jgi:hypothetical protein